MYRQQAEESHGRHQPVTQGIHLPFEEQPADKKYLDYREDRPCPGGTESGQQIVAAKDDHNANQDQQ